MEEYLRQLTHDNEQLATSWPKVFEQLHKLSIDIPDDEQLSFKVNTLNALVDYVLVDNEPLVNHKVTFLESVLQKVSDKPLIPLEELVRILCRVLDVDDVNDEYNVVFLRRFYFQLALGERLSELPSVNLIESILTSLQKHSFLNGNFKDQMQEKWKELLSRGLFSPITSDRNKLNSDQTITHMRSQFQHFYK